LALTEAQIIELTALTEVTAITILRIVVNEDKLKGNNNNNNIKFSPQDALEATSLTSKMLKKSILHALLSYETVRIAEETRLGIKEGKKQDLSELI
jgi:hypothetical protein